MDEQATGADGKVSQAFAKTVHEVVVGKPIKYFLLGDDDEALGHFEEAKQSCIATTLARLHEEKALSEFVTMMRPLAPILITGSSGYLGSALVHTLRSHGLEAVGFDLVPSKTTDFLGCVSDALAVAAASKACKSIIHTAALHAPNLDFYTDADYERVNVIGTENVLRQADEQKMSGVVFSSTTSLMNTAEVKRQSAVSSVVLKASVDYGTPRNIYGVTKKRAEASCAGEFATPVAILRCSRFFVEDKYDTSVEKSCRSAVTLSNGNVKANELLCRVRASLEDVIMSHLVALVRISRPAASRTILGPLVVSAPSPLLQADDLMTDPGDPVRRLYSALGWDLPSRFDRVYDSHECWRVLEWQPRWSIERLTSDFEKTGTRELIESGRY